MNTSKQVNAMIGLMFVFLIGTLFYFVWDSARAGDAEERQIVDNAERGGGLFSLNCRSCHGISGLATLENVKLPGLPLNIEINRPVDPKTGEVDVGELLIRQNRVRDTIVCGRVGTLMPQWAEDQGGPLNDFQIEQLVALITGAMPGLDPPDDIIAVSELGWEAAVEAADHADLLEGKRLARSVGPEDTLFVLTDAQGLTPDSLLRIDDEVVKIKDAPESGGDDEILVKRGAFGTRAAEHEEGAQVFAGPIEPPTGPLTGENGDAPCGQRGVAAPSPAPSPTPAPSDGETPTPAGTTAEIKMIPVLKFDKTELTIAADTDVVITADNTEAAIPHNFAVYTSQDAAEGGEKALAATEICAGPCTNTVTVNLSAGEYFFRCDVHPTQMIGTLTVVAE